MERCVRGLTRGLLEVVPLDVTSIYTERATLMVGLGTKQCQFFHRTARDFVLDHPKLGQIIDIKTVTSLETIHRLRLAEIMTYDYRYRYEICGEFEASVFSTVFDRQIPVPALEAYCKVFKESVERLGIKQEVSYFRSPQYDSKHPFHASFVHLAACRDAGEYVLKVARERPELLTSTSQLNLLVSAGQRLNTQLVRHLLEAGASLETDVLCERAGRPESCSAWMVLLHHFGSLIHRMYYPEEHRSATWDRAFEILEILLEHKKFLRDLAVGWKLSSRPGDTILYVTIHDMIEHYQPSNRDQLLSLMAEPHEHGFRASIQRVRNRAKGLYATRNAQPDTRLVHYNPSDNCMDHDSGRPWILLCGDWQTTLDLEYAIC
ncbi:hypothetical protein BJY04DRAFT_222583 [Aspergillus karnatakaensis]|uniref:uncharacterized protein n=1 Tax=Aspergillus karnatakaensis TaxID=1810916 RepID=UPI003CCD80BB